MRSTRAVWVAFAASLIIALLGAGWLTRTVLADERAAQRAVEQAVREENARLALWRMDSAVAPLLALENARPTEPDGEVTQPASPVRELVTLHFEIEPSGAMRVTDDASTASPSVLSVLRHAAAGSRALQALWRGEDSALSPPPTRQVAQLQTLGTSNAQAVDVQQQKNSQEWFARSSSVKLSNAYSNLSKQAVALPPRQPPRPPEMLQPLWLGESLVLMRLAHLDRGPVIQGTLLDWDALRTNLLQQTTDLLTGAQLVGERDAPRDAREEHRLATLPVVLEPGRSVGAQLNDPDRPALHLALAGAWGAMLLAVAAVAMLLVGTLALSERRAAFVSSVTHELRTPLTTFRMYTEMLTSGMVPDEAQRASYLGTLHRESERLAHLVDNVLAYSRIERGRGPARLERFDLGAMVQRQVDRLRERASQAGMELALALPPGETWARGDPGAVEQVLFNLVDNAAKYAIGSTEKRIELSLASRGGQVAMHVRDWGRGLDAEAKRGLFTPFSKSAQRAALSAPGVGLGLALCRQLAREMKGDLRFEPPPGGGAAFTLLLPRA